MNSKLDLCQNSNIDADVEIQLISAHLRKTLCKCTYYEREKLALQFCLDMSRSLADFADLNKAASEYENYTRLCKYARFAMRFATAAIPGTLLNKLHRQFARIFLIRDYERQCNRVKQFFTTFQHVLAHTNQCDVSSSIRTHFRTMLECLFEYARCRNNNFRYLDCFCIDTIAQDRQLDDAERFGSLFAFCQAGKTFQLILCMIAYVISGYTCVFVCDNSNSAATQVIKRIAAEFQQISDFIQAEYPALHSLFFEVMRPPVMYTDKTRQQAFKNAFKTTPSIVVALKHHTHINAIIDELSGSDMKVHVIFDEAHQTGGYEKVDREHGRNDLGRVKYSEKVGIMKGMKQVAKLSCVTATPQDVLIAENSQIANRVSVLAPKHEYRGAESIAFKTFAEDDFDSELSLLIDELNCTELQVRNDTRHQCTNQHPHILLIVKEREIAKQSEEMRCYVDGFPALTIVNITGKEITIHCPAFGDDVFIGGITTNRSADGLFRLNTSDYLFSDVIQTFAEIGVEKIPFLCIIGHDMVSIGTSICSDYNHPQNWHLTDLFYVPSETTKAHRVIQQIGRLCGNHGDNVKLTCHTTKACRELYVKSMHCLNVQMENIANPNNRERRVYEVMDDIEHYDTHAPSNKKYYNVRGGENRIVPNPHSRNEKRYFDSDLDLSYTQLKSVLDGGHVDLAEEPEDDNATLVGESTNTDNVQTEIDSKYLLSPEEYERMKKRFENWSSDSCDSGIKKLVSSVNPTEVYLYADFVRLAREFVPNNIGHLYSGDKHKGHGYGKLFVKNGNKVYLNPLLVMLHQTYL